jgi:hypothetical protein
MCGDSDFADQVEDGPDGEDVFAATDHPLTRRRFMGGLGAVAGGVLLAPWAGQVAASAASFTGTRPFLAAMHVHGSWSEQGASWEAYGPRGRGLVDVIFMTDHDYRALADRYWTSLQDAPVRSTSTGSFRQKTATKAGRSLRLLAESATSSAASLTLAVDDVSSKAVWDRLRTSIEGQSLRHTFGSSRLTNGATYEVRIRLSNHPVTASRPAGTFQLWFRFGAGLAAGRRLEGGGLVGVVTQGLPAAGTTVTLDLQSSVQQLWPDMLAADNGFYGLSFVVTSPRTGAVADVQVSDLSFVRTRHDAASIAATQRLLADTYGPRYGLTMHPAIEVGRGVRHMNAFAAPQYIPDQALNHPATLDAFYTQAVSGTHARGGLVSWNHPFGANVGPLLSAADQTNERHQVFADLLAHDLYGSDILEVGYPVRGQVDINTHLALWDTFSRRARFLTGNGVNDDHSAKDWRALNNGFATGVWAQSVAHVDLMTALAAGRAYTSHAGKWAGGQLDMLVDDAVAMGQASVSSRTSRTLAVFAANLPAGSSVDLVRGPVDYTGEDPGTAVIATIAASTFGSDGTASRSVNTSTSCFVRAQVRNATGAIIGVGNPVWLLREPPPGGLPKRRAA